MGRRGGGRARTARASSESTPRRAAAATAPWSSPSSRSSPRAARAHARASARASLSAARARATSAHAPQERLPRIIAVSLGRNTRIPRTCSGHSARHEPQEGLSPPRHAPQERLPRPIFRKGPREWQRVTTAASPSRSSSSASTTSGFRAGTAARNPPSWRSSSKTPATCKINLDYAVRFDHGDARAVRRPRRAQVFLPEESWVERDLIPETPARPGARVRSGIAISAAFVFLPGFLDSLM